MGMEFLEKNYLTLTYNKKKDEKKKNKKKKKKNIYIYIQRERVTEHMYIELFGNTQIDIIQLMEYDPSCV